MTAAEIIDLVAADLTASVDLPAHHRWLYVEPRIVTPEFTPMLAVFLATTTYELQTTMGGYDPPAHELKVAWVVDSTHGAETGGVGDAEVAKANFDVSQALVERAKAYAVGIPGADLYATVERATYRLVDGLLWRAEITLNLDEWTG